MFVLAGGSVTQRATKIVVAVAAKSVGPECQTSRAGCPVGRFESRRDREARDRADFRGPKRDAPPEAVIQGAG
jgi:hypothetical protein